MVAKKPVQKGKKVKPVQKKKAVAVKKAPAKVKAKAKAKAKVGASAKAPTKAKPKAAAKVSKASKAPKATATLKAKSKITKKAPAKKAVAKKAPAIAKKKVSTKDMSIQPVTHKKAAAPAAPAAKKTSAKKLPQAVPAMKPSTSTIIGAINFTPYQASAGEEYMNDAQREHFRKILQMWKQQLMQEVDTTVVHMKEEAIAYPDPLDRASQEEGFNLELRTRDRERKLIKKIEQALDALDKGEYGYCEDCGAEIGIRRLEARPTADKCIDCKTYEEIREKQVGSV